VIESALVFSCGYDHQSITHAYRLRGTICYIAVLVILTPCYGSNDHVTAIVSITVGDGSRLDGNLRTGSGSKKTERLVSGTSDRMPRLIK
jgi:hypothetical protein